jgi:hypothetical protein
MVEQTASQLMAFHHLGSSNPTALCGFCIVHPVRELRAILAGTSRTANSPNFDMGCREPRITSRC